MEQYLLSSCQVYILSKGLRVDLFLYIFFIMKKYIRTFFILFFCGQFRSNVSQYFGSFESRRFREILVVFGNFARRIFQNFTVVLNNSRTVPLMMYTFADFHWLLIWNVRDSLKTYNKFSLVKNLPKFDKRYFPV